MALRRGAVSRAIRPGAETCRVQPPKTPTLPAPMGRCAGEPAGPKGTRGPGEDCVDLLTVAHSAAKGTAKTSVAVKVSFHSLPRMGWDPTEKLEMTMKSSIFFPFSFLPDPKMPAPSLKPWIALVTAGGLAITSSLLASPAYSAQCPSSSKFIDIFGSNLLSPYTCDFGSTTYTFNVGGTAGELARGAADEATLELSETPLYQIIKYNNLKQSTKSTIIFETEYVSPIDFTYVSFSNVEVTFGANPAPINLFLFFSPDFPDPLPPAQQNRSLLTEYSVKRPLPSPLPTLTSLTQRIAKVPGPLPIAGATLTFAFSRKLRRRIKSVS